MNFIHTMYQIEFTQSKIRKGDNKAKHETNKLQVEHAKLKILL